MPLMKRTRCRPLKKAVCKDQCRTIDLLFEKDGQELLVQGRAYDDGAAFRLRLLGEGDVAVTDEVCGFCMPEEARTIYGMRHLMSYEDHYHPIPVEDPVPKPLCLPHAV